MYSSFKRPLGWTLSGGVLAALGLAALTPTVARAQTQDLFVTNSRANTISRYAGTGPGTFSTTATTISDPSLNIPVDLAFDSHGDLFVTNALGAAGQQGSIAEFAAGATPGSFGAATAFVDPNLRSPIGIVSDAGGDLFVANQGLTSKNGSIAEFLAGATPGTFSGSTSLNSVGHQLYGLTMDARGDLFAASASSNSVVEFAAGATPGTFGAATSFMDPSLNAPESLAFDKSGDLFVANAGGGSSGLGSITEFAAGAMPGTFGAVRAFTDPSLNQPSSLAFDPQGDLFAVNFHGGIGTSGTITKFALTGPGTFGPGQVVETGLSGPEGIAFGPSAPVPEASQAVSLGLLLMLGMGGVVGARKKGRRESGKA